MIIKTKQTRQLSKSRGTNKCLSNEIRIVFYFMEYVKGCVRLAKMLRF